MAEEVEVEEDCCAGDAYGLLEPVPLLQQRQRRPPQAHRYGDDAVVEAVEVQEDCCVGDAYVLLERVHLLQQRPLQAHRYGDGAVVEAVQVQDYQVAVDDDNDQLKLNRLLGRLQQDQRLPFLHDLVVEAVVPGTILVQLGSPRLDISNAIELVNVMYLGLHLDYLASHWLIRWTMDGPHEILAMELEANWQKLEISLSSTETHVFSFRCVVCGAHRDNRLLHNTIDPLPSMKSTLLAKPTQTFDDPYALLHATGYHC